VTITINNVPRPIDAGEAAVKELKKLGNVVTGDELVQIVEGEVVALGDNASVCIRGDEVFVSHPRQGGAS
jgi:hypothetical protein